MKFHEINLYFLRHAIAEDRETWHGPDDLRPLTELGRKKMHRAAQGIHRVGIKCDLLLSSPYLRAQETAEILQQTASLSPRLTLEPELEIGGSLAKLIQKIKKQAANSAILVGHEPTLSEWVEELLGMGPNASVCLKKAALCHLRLFSQTKPWETQLIGFYSPKLLRALAG